MIQIVTKVVVLSLFSVPLTIFTYIIQDIYMIIYNDIVTNIYLGNQSNKIKIHFLGSARLESVTNYQYKYLTHLFCLDVLEE